METVDAMLSARSYTNRQLGVLMAELFCGVAGLSASQRLVVTQAFVDVSEQAHSSSGVLGQWARLSSVDSL